MKEERKKIQERSRVLLFCLNGHKSIRTERDTAQYQNIIQVESKWKKVKLCKNMDSLPKLLGVCLKLNKTFKAAEF